MIDLGFLGIMTIAIAVVTFALWQKTHSFGFVVGAFFLYYWSLYGAWPILDGGDFGKHAYLLDDLVALRVDANYMWTLGLYGAFVLVVLTTAYYFTASGKVPASKRETVLVVQGRSLLIVSMIAGGLSYLLVSESLFLSPQVGRSVYQLVRVDNELGANFSLHAIVNRAALVPAAIAMATIVSGRDARFVVMRATWLNVLSLVIVIGSMVCLCVVLGNKNELLFAATLGALVYLGNARRPNWSRLAWLFAAGVFLFPIINSTRSKSLDEFTQGINMASIVDAFSSMGMTGEAFAAHMSLYGVIDEEVPFVYGQSFVALVASVVPRVFWEDRPKGIYAYYINSIDASAQQGFTIHHGTGWYLNFGVPGLLAGAFLLGWLWAILYNRMRNSSRIETIFWRVSGTFAYWAFTANMPNIIRAGIEGYKGFLFHSLVTPIAVLIVCCKVARRSPAADAQLTRRRLPAVRHGWRSPIASFDPACQRESLQQK